MQSAKPTSATAAAAAEVAVAIDFGTSNSAVALPLPGGEVRLVALEDGQPTMPTAVFYLAEGPALAEPERLFGRAALAAYIDGVDGRLMRSMKSILGSPMLEQRTDIGGGRALRYAEVVGGYLRQLKRLAEASAGHALPRVVLGRPVFFVDDDPVRDAQAQAALHAAAHAVGFKDVAFQYEPIAAALDHERALTQEELVLVADIGGGTSDFSLVRVGPARRQRVDRRADILANHGVHIAGTDFDRRILLAAILPLFGFGARGPMRDDGTAREVPSSIYFDLATWHLINTAYTPSRLAEMRSMRGWYADAAVHRRLMAVLEQRLGHALAAAAEAAKIEVAGGSAARIDLGLVESGLRAALDLATAAATMDEDIERIVAAAQQAARQAGVAPQAVDALYFTGGSTGLTPLVQRIAAAFPAARSVRGERFSSVARGLGLHAARAFGDQVLRQIPRQVPRQVPR